MIKKLTLISAVLFSIILFPALVFATTDEIGGCGHTDGNNHDNVFYFPITASSSGVLQSIGMNYVSGGSHNFKVAIYNSVGHLLGQSASTPTVASGWADATVPGSIAIVSGNYFLAFNSDNDGENYCFDSASVNSSEETPHSFSSAFLTDAYFQYGYGNLFNMRMTYASAPPANSDFTILYPANQTYPAGNPIYFQFKAHGNSTFLLQAFNDGSLIFDNSAYPTGTLVENISTIGAGYHNFTLFSDNGGVTNTTSVFYTVADNSWNPANTTFTYEDGVILWNDTPGKDCATTPYLDTGTPIFDTASLVSSRSLSDTRSCSFIFPNAPLLIKITINISEMYADNGGFQIYDSHQDDPYSLGNPAIAIITNGTKLYWGRPNIDTSTQLKLLDNDYLLNMITKQIVFAIDYDNSSIDVYYNGVLMYAGQSTFVALSPANPLHLMQMAGNRIEIDNFELSGVYEPPVTTTTTTTTSSTTTTTETTTTTTTTPTPSGLGLPAISVSLIILAMFILTIGIIYKSYNTVTAKKMTVKIFIVTIVVIVVVISLMNVIFNLLA